MISRKLILLVLAVSFVLFPLLNSCSSTKMAALPCPEPVNNNHLRKANKKSINYKYLARNKPFRNKKNSSLRASVSGKKTDINSPLTSLSEFKNIELTDRQQSETPWMVEAQSGPNVENDLSLVRIEYINVPSVNTNKNYIDNILPYSIPVDCDTIMLKSGKMVVGKVAEIGPYEIRYRRCDNMDGPVIVLRKTELAEIRYQNGAKEYFTDTDQQANQIPYPQAFIPVIDQRKVEGLGLAGFIASLTGLIIAGIPLGIIAVIFGIISLGKIKKQPARYMGRGFAIASFIIGLIDIVAVIILLAAV